MTTMKTNAIRRPPLTKWFAFQAGVILLMGLVFWIKSPVAAYSALLGGIIFFLPNVYFALKAFRYSGARAAKQIMGSFYKGETGKLILCAILFTVVFKSIKPLDVAALFLTFAIMLVTNWLTPVVFGGKTQQS